MYRESLLCAVMTGDADPYPSISQEVHVFTIIFLLIYEASFREDASVVGIFDQFFLDLFIFYYPE
jgi:hypothetical protein